MVRSAAQGAVQRALLAMTALPLHLVRRATH